MSVSLQPLEFTECLSDSPHFRKNLVCHEKELTRTSQQIRRLIEEVKDVVKAGKSLAAAQVALSATMEQFDFGCIDTSMTEDERIIRSSLQRFAHLIRTMEEKRDRVLFRAHEKIIQDLEKFRKEHIGAVKEGKKKYDRTIAKFCQSQEHALSLSTKHPEAIFQKADAAMDMAERDFCQASLEYVFQLQAVQERKKFELVEILQGFVYGWWTFHHKAHVKEDDPGPLVRDLQLPIQRIRSNFDETTKLTESLMNKLMEVRQMTKEGEAVEESTGGVSRAGYVFLMEKKTFGTTWRKQYCTYEKNSSTLTLMPYNQINVKTEGLVKSVVVEGARLSPNSERRFCWEALVHERTPLVLQAPTERERTSWLKELPPTMPRAPVASLWPLDYAGFKFVTRLVIELEARGLDEQGLYRVKGEPSNVSRLVALGRARRLPPELHAWESQTLTSALKSYLRALPEPLLTRRLHGEFLAAAKCECVDGRVRRLRTLVGALPPNNRNMLHMLLTHLRRVAARRDRNLMTPSNLAVCFGPTLLRAERETVASIRELKFYNVVVEALLENVAAVFASSTPATLPASHGVPAPAAAPPKLLRPKVEPGGNSSPQTTLLSSHPGPGPSLAELNIQKKRHGEQGGGVFISCFNQADRFQHQPSSQVLQSGKNKCRKCISLGQYFCPRCKTLFCKEHVHRQQAASSKHPALPCSNCGFQHLIHHVGH